MSIILIVDDDVQLGQSFSKLLSEEGYQTLLAFSGEEGLDIVKSKEPDLIIMDIRMPGLNGLETFKLIKKLRPKIPVIIMTAFGTTETAIEATKIGAFDYVLKPFEIPEMLNLVKQALEAGRMMSSHVAIDQSSESDSQEAIVGKSSAMQEVYKAIGRVAPTDATVLIRGESGVGKELVARAIYQYSLRANKPFLIINCVAIPETLLESELFGYERGAFTGAVSRRLGRIEQASGGTIFLDEIGDMPLATQAKILRLLEEKSIARLGGYDTIPVDVRIISATNRNLERAISEGTFREDLYYRLKVVTIELPALKDRKGDISILSEYFLNTFSNEMNIDNPGITAEGLKFLESQPWPGNVRELGNTLRKALIFSRGYPIKLEELRQIVQNVNQIHAKPNSEIEPILRKWISQNLVSGVNKEPYNYLSDYLSSIIISECLDLTGGNRSKAAKLLGLSRPTLQSKIEKHRLTFETSVKSNKNNE